MDPSRPPDKEEAKAPASKKATAPAKKDSKAPAKKRAKAPASPPPGDDALDMPDPKMKVMLPLCRPEAMPTHMHDTS